MKKIILLLFLVILAFSGCSSSGNSDEYVLTIDGDKVSKGEYMVYLREQRQFFEESGGEDIWEVDNIDGVSPEDLAKQNAINSVIQTKIAVTHFDGYNISLTDDDKQKIEKKASTLYEEIGEDKAKQFSINLNDIKKITRELYIGDKVFELQTNGVTLDDTEFEQEFDSYIADNIKDYKTVTLKQIAFTADNYEKAVEANDKIIAGEDYDSVMLAYSTDQNNDAFTLTDNMYSTKINTALYNMKAGSVSDILKDDDGTYYIFKVVSVDTADMEPVRESYKAQCLQEKKQEVYNSQIEKWQADVSIERNDEVYNSISVFDC